MEFLLKWGFYIYIGIFALAVAILLIGIIGHIVLRIPLLLAFLAAAALIIIFGRLIIGKSFSNWQYTSEEKAALDEAEMKDKEARQSNAAAKRKAHADRNMRVENTADDITHRIAAVKEKIAKEDRIIASSVMPAKDRHLEAVDYVIGQLEGLRANTLSEALYQYDDYSDKKHRRNLQYLQDKWDREQREEREREEYWKAQEHRWKMESLEKERLNEVKEANKKLEDMKRGW